MELIEEEERVALNHHKVYILKKQLESFWKKKKCWIDGNPKNGGSVL